MQQYMGNPDETQTKFPIIVCRFEVQKEIYRGNSIMTHQILT